MNLITDMSMKIWSNNNADITSGPVLAVFFSSFFQTDINHSNQAGWKHRLAKNFLNITLQLYIEIPGVPAAGGFCSCERM